MKFISTFSGVEAASLAWEPLGWEPLAYSEIDEFPSAVLAARWPDVPNLGDITKVDWGEVISKYGRPDVLVGGSPCQSFSIAGGRDSLDGASRLMFEYIRACREIQSEWIVWENVPGALSARDNAFGLLVSSLQECGYVSIAWRVLDAQFFGVAQRRRRVFLVGRLGEGGSAPAVLFEQDSVRGNTQTGKQKREALAAEARRGASQAGGDAGVEPTAFKWFAGARARSAAIYDDGATPTLTNSDSHMPAVTVPDGDSCARVMAVRTANTGANGCGISDDLAHTLDTTGPEAVAFAQNQREVSENLCHTLTHEGQGDIHSAVLVNDEPVIMASGQAHAEIAEGGVATTLSARQFKDPPILFEERVQATEKTSSRRSVRLTETSSSSTTSPSVEGGSSSSRDEGGPDAEGVFCVADDNANAAIDLDVAGTLKVGGGDAFIAYSPTAMT